ncbi:DNA polymerase III subunit [Roseiconus lacunae]|uniref:DNA polymerase III subunit delta n=1 Tax=Roseiconus lacunae TaxID=2605694 RepID=A0ABT7PQZ1_9BACT|nr:DNA polymerase III subunit delta' [Roseiconus lacunae]MCD0460302.1 DNA polymerase III subunit delta' [Roseiconus lacunae]MDM4018903.1 DNA polymerase III subunit delta' [Roseiconus lacunae]
MIDGWSSLIGNDHLRGWFANSISQGRFGGSLLFVGPSGVGKRSVATLLAQTLLCDRHPAREMNPCGQCEACVQVRAETHPDVIRVRKPKDKTTIPVDLLIGAPEVRMQEGFCRDVRLSPYCGKRKVAILEDADFLNEEGANCLLKTLEEPPADAVIILVGTSEQKQLPTIRSRCQVIRFRPLSDADAIRLIRDVHQCEASDEAMIEAVDIAAGDISAALRLLDESTRQFRSALSDALGQRVPDPAMIRRIVTDRMEGAGKESPKRRAALRDVFAMCIGHYRKVMRDQASESQARMITLARLDRSVRALRELDRMANLSTLVDCFAADLSVGTSGDRGGIGS